MEDLSRVLLDLRQFRNEVRLAEDRGAASLDLFERAAALVKRLDEAEASRDDRMEARELVRRVLKVRVGDR